MRTIKVNLKGRNYNIIIGVNTLTSIGEYLKKLKIGLDAYIISNQTIKNRYGKTLINSLKKAGINFKFKLVRDTERSKSLDTASSVIKDISRFDRQKHIFIIAFGGGVVGDLSGFLASIYKRGVSYIQIPTTILAQVDSSIGGKTGVDLSQGKNLLGAFYQPKLVYSDVGLLKSLDKKQVRSGMAEVIKYGIIKDPYLFNYLERKYRDILCSDPSSLEFIVWRCSGIKAKIVETDEREEKGLRTILNFGHTIGHAIEAGGKFKAYSHGESIALGMLVASGISEKLQLIKREKAQRIEKLIKSVGLPVKIKGVSLEEIIKKHYHDKKFIGRKNRFVLATDIGKVIVLENIPLKVIKEAVQDRIST